MLTKFELQTMMDDITKELLFFAEAFQGTGIDSDEIQELTNKCEAVKTYITKSGEICITLKDITPFKQRKQKS